MTELGQTSNPRELIKGDPDAILENARVLRGRAESTIATGESLSKIDTGSWTGPASEQFHEQHQTDVPKWLQAGDGLDSGESALTEYAETLRWGQGQAAEAIRLFQEGENATAQAKTAHDRIVADANTQTQANASHGDPTVVKAPPFVDPGEEKRQAARDMLARARQQVVEAGDRCASTLNNEAEAAPEAVDHDAEFFQGMGQAFSDFGNAIGDIFTDPAGTVAAFAHNVTHPVETFKNFVSWDDWANGHGDRATGKLYGDTIIAMATAGIGKGAKSLFRRHRDSFDGDDGPTVDHGHGNEGTQPPATPEPPPRGQPATRDDLNERQSANSQRYEKKLPGSHEPVQYERMPDGGVRMSSRVPAANIPGSYADYIKIVDADGNTVRYVKETYGPDGSLIHRKEK